MRIAFLLLVLTSCAASEAPRETARACPTVEAAVQAQVLRDSTWREVALLQRAPERRVRDDA